MTMPTVLKKLLSNILVLLIALLPYGMSYSMPVGDSRQHCKVMEMTEMQPAAIGHETVTDSHDVTTGQSMQGSCCDNKGDCAKCTNITAFYFDVLQFSDLFNDEVFIETPRSFISQVIPPPFRPPANPYI